MPALSGDLFTRAAAIVANRLAEGQGGEVEAILARGLAQARAFTCAAIQLHPANYLIQSHALLQPKGGSAVGATVGAIP